MSITCRFSKVLAVVFCLVLTMGHPLRADLKYEETSKMTGGMLQGMTKMMGMFGAKGLNNNSTIHYFKGDCMRADNFPGNELTTSEIVCLDRDQIISIDHKKKSYSVTTFEQMRQQMEKALQQAKQKRTEMGEKQPQSPPTDVKVQPKLSVKDTGENRVINGYNAKRYLMSFQIEAQDEKTKDQGNMGMDGDVWMSKDVGSFEERTAFYVKYAKKMASPEMMEQAKLLMSGLQDPRMGQSLSEMQRHVDKMEGVAVLTVASFKISGTSQEGSQQQSPPSQSAQKPKSSETPSGIPEISANLGKVLGGLGGFGRKKKKEEPKPQTESQEPHPVESSQGPGGTSTSSVNLMQMTTELKNVSRSSLDTALFEIPKAYKLKETKNN